MDLLGCGFLHNASKFLQLELGHLNLNSDLFPDPCVCFHCYLFFSKVFKVQCSFYSTSSKVHFSHPWNVIGKAIVCMILIFIDNDMLYHLIIFSKVYLENIIICYTFHLYPAKCLLIVYSLTDGSFTVES